MQANAPEGLIHLDVAATDREGKPFSGLAAKDFTLMDNGVPQKIVSFAASNEATDENERLTEVVLVLDEVNLSPAHFELVKAWQSSWSSRHFSSSSQTNGSIRH
jgi:hypothetical protein